MSLPGLGLVILWIMIFWGIILAGEDHGDGV
jgi:hypothetical protein